MVLQHTCAARAGSRINSAPGKKHFGTNIPILQVCHPVKLFDLCKIMKRSNKVFKTLRNLTQDIILCTFLHVFTSSTPKAIFSSQCKKDICIACWANNLQTLMVQFFPATNIPSPWKGHYDCLTHPPNCRTQYMLHWYWYGYTSA